MLENMLETGVNSTLVKNEKIADQALFPPSATALALGNRICLNSRTVATEVLHGGSLRNRRQRLL